MIERNKLGLKEITVQEYDRLRDSINEPRTYPKTEMSKFGFARIITPLEYENYEDLLRNFAETPYARRASVQRKKSEWEKGKKWFIFWYNQLNDKKIAFLAEEAINAGFLYISFFCEKCSQKEINNEIKFKPIEPDNKRVRSISIQIPGEERGLYSWDGSEKPYFQILGIYVPPSI